MATVTLGGTPTTIDLAESTTNWGGDTFSLEPDIKVQGSNSVACVQTVNGNNDIYVTGTWDFSGTGVGDQHLRLWFNITYIGNLSATNPIQIFLYDGTNTAYYYWDKATDYSGGWAQAVIYTGDTPDSGTVTKSSITRIGMRFVTSSKPRNVPANAWFDAWRYGDGYYATGGTSGDEIGLDLIAADDLTNAYGIVIKELNGSVSIRGDIQIGNGSTTTWFKMDNEEAFFVVEQVNAGLYKFHGNGTGCRIDIADATFKSAGTAAKDKFDFDMSETNLLTCSVIDTKLTNADTVDYKSGQTATGNIYNGCGQITHGGADKDDTVVKNYEGTVDTSAMIYDVATNPTGYLDDSIFTKGVAATHAIEFGTTSPLTMTLTGIDFSGYNASNGQTDSALHIKRTSSTVTITISGGSTPSYKSDGATVVIDANITVTFANLKDNSEVRIYESIIEENTDISFTSTNTISSASSGFGSFAADDIIRVSGSDDNDGTYTVATAAAGSLTVTPATITTESAGATVKIKKTNQTELAGIEDATAGSTDARTFAASIAAGTLVDYVIHCYQTGDEIYQNVRVTEFTWPSVVQTITINQIIDRNAEN